MGDLEPLRVHLTRGGFSLGGADHRAISPPVWLRLAGASLIMPAMGEHSERTEPFTNEQPEHLTFAEAGERLNISVDAVRMRVKRGRLASVRVNNRTFVVWPQPDHVEQPHEPRTEPNSSPVQDDSRLISALESRIASLEHQLSERTEEIRRRDHIIAGFLERLPDTRELVPGAILDADETPATRASGGDAPVNSPEASQQGVRAHMASSASQGHSGDPVPAEVSLATSWRRWWRRITGQ